jgi:hypothetical protein
MSRNLAKERIDSVYRAGISFVGSLVAVMTDLMRP